MFNHVGEKLEVIHLTETVERIVESAETDENVYEVGDGCAGEVEGVQLQLVKGGVQSRLEQVVGALLEQLSQGVVVLLFEGRHVTRFPLGAVPGK